MKHLMILYMDLSLSAGIVCVSLMVSHYLHTHDSFLRRFSVFYSAFSLMMAMTLVYYYIYANLGILPRLFYRTLGVAGLIINALFLITLAWYNGHLKHRGHMQLRTACFLLAGTIYVLAGTLTMTVNPAGIITFPSAWGLILPLIFAGFLVYSFLPYRSRPGGDPLEKKLFQRFTVLALIMLPGLAIDLVLNNRLAFKFYPLLYLCLSVYLTGLISSISASRRQISPATLIAMPGETWLARYQLSGREKEILAEVLGGFSNQQIADKLFISVPTVKTHVQKIFQKTGVSGRMELIRFMMENP